MSNYDGLLFVLVKLMDKRGLHGVKKIL